jgi:hypothetical protein
MTGPSIAWPSERPVLVSALGSAQRPGGNQPSTVPAWIGKIGACVAPTKRRTTTSETRTPVAEAAIRLGAKPVNQVSTPQVIVMLPSASRGPSFSPKMPPGTCRNVYVTLNAPRIQPSSALVNPNSVRMLGAAYDKALRRK